MTRQDYLTIFGITIFDITPCIIGMFIDSLKQNSILFACLLMNL